MELTKYVKMIYLSQYLLLSLDVIMMFLKFVFILLIISSILIFVVKGFIKLFNKNLRKKQYRLTNKFNFLFTYIIIFLLALIIGKKFLYNFF